MGGNMARRLVRDGHSVVGFNRSTIQAERLAVEEKGFIAAFSLEETVQKLFPPRVIWIMIPSGDSTEKTIKEVAELLSRDDIIVDGGNSNYKDTMRRAMYLGQKGIQFVDVGTSGGIWGLSEGYSMMVGGKKEVVERLSPIFQTLAPAPDKGWGYVGPNGAGHFVKMVHNGIEYGLMQAYAEGFEILWAKRDFGLDLHKVSEIWRFGSVVRSWLLDLVSNALADDPELSDIRDWVDDSGEGRWTVTESIDLDVPAPVISLALQMRFVSRQEESYAAKLLTAMRNQFGGHALKAET
jgi:6-phosphogluconate dehydrogenase